MAASIGVGLAKAALGGKVGGKVVDMNLISVTLRETHEDGHESHLRVPNSLFFQRITRRWREAPPPRPLPDPDAPRKRSRQQQAGGGGASLF